jgi:hypothetical protein
VHIRLAVEFAATNKYLKKMPLSPKAYDYVYAGK